jgi:hypothetical protein
VDADAFLKLALRLPEAAQSSHMGGVDIRVRNKIFASPADRANGAAILKLTAEQQEMMCAAEPDVFAAEPGCWGRQGWTRLTVAAADEATVRSALWAAWRNVAPKTLAKAHDGAWAATKD